MCSNGMTGIESSDGKACCPSECGSCSTGCGRRRLSRGDGSDSSDNSGTACGTRKRRRRLTYGHDDSNDGYEDYCDCTLRRSLRSGSSADSWDSEVMNLKAFGTLS